MTQGGIRLADMVAKPLGQDFATLRADQLILQESTIGIDHQNYHEDYLLGSKRDPVPFLFRSPGFRVQW